MESAVNAAALCVNFYEQAEDSAVRFSVIVARCKNEWIFCRHRERDTWECPG